MSEQEKLRDQIIKIRDEITTQIENSSGDIKNTNLDALFQLTQQLESMNVRTDLPNIGHGIKTLIDNIRTNNLTVETLRQLQRTSQSFIDELSK